MHTPRYYIYHFIGQTLRALRTGQQCLGRLLLFSPPAFPPPGRGRVSEGLGGVSRHIDPEVRFSELTSGEFVARHNEFQLAAFLSRTAKEPIGTEGAARSQA